jgi:hypothetical protein
MRATVLFLLVVVLCMGQVCAPRQVDNATQGTTDGATNGEGTTGGGGHSGGAQNGTAGGGGTGTGGASGRGAIIADHLASAAFDSIPTITIQAVQSNYRIWYGHTSHGSQILTGMQMLYSTDSRYAFNTGSGSLSIQDDGGVDLGTDGNLQWATTTRELLNQPGNTINVVMWSWCGGVSENTEAGITAYLGAMSQLESDYPSVVFIYMTGHLDGTGPGGNLYARNNQIRAFCVAHGKILFDFADIESYDPSGVYYPNESDACSWCQDWCTEHTCASCDGCAHSECFNCYRKGQAFWWMMARLVGWAG